MIGYTTMTTLPNGDLHFALTEDGKDELAYRVEENRASDDQIFLDLIEDHLGDEFVVLQPEEVGALTGSLIIGKDVIRDDDQNPVDAEMTWWFPDYQVASYTDTLASERGIIFTKGE